MLELIQQNPIISLVVLVVPTIGVAWKVFEVLYVKPRDFRISVLEKNVDELRKEIQRADVLPGQVVSGVSVFPSTAPTKQSPVTSVQTEAVKKIVEATSLQNDMSAFCEAWKSKALTELQRDQFEKNYLGQKVVWRARLQNVSEERDGLLWVSLISEKERDYSVHILAIFESRYKEALLMVKKGEVVTVSGVIEQFSLTPLIKNCSLVRGA